MCIRDRHDEDASQHEGAGPRGAHRQAKGITPTVWETAHVAILPRRRRVAVSQRTRHERYPRTAQHAERRDHTPVAGHEFGRRRKRVLQIGQLESLHRIDHHVRRKRGNRAEHQHATAPSLRRRASRRPQTEHRQHRTPCQRIKPEAQWNIDGVPRHNGLGVVRERNSCLLYTSRCV